MKLITANEKTNHFIVLEFVLTTPKPQEHVNDVFNEIKTQYADWQWANTIVCYYIQASIASHL